MSRISMNLGAQRAYSATLGRGAFCVAVTATCPEAGGPDFARAIAEAGADFGKSILLVKASSLVQGGDESSLGEDVLTCARQTPAGYLELDVTANGVLHRTLNDSNGLSGLLDGWRVHVDGVVLDLPAFGGAGAGVYTPLAASAATAVLMVGLPGFTESHVMGEAMKWLADSGATLSGLILNDERNPTLAQEILREAGRLRTILPFAPRLAERLVSRWAPLHRHH